LAGHYQRIHDSLVRNKKIDAHPPLKFIAASAENDDGKGGGSAQVQQWAPKLAKLGLLNFRGLVDRDQGVASTKTVRVINRYSVENYVLDPLTLVALLIRGGIEQPFSKMPIFNRRIHDIPKLPLEDLQLMVDDICTFLQKAEPGFEKRGVELFTARYVGLPDLQMPQWLRDTRGHRTEADGFGISHAVLSTLNNLSKEAGMSLIFTSGLQSAIDLQADVLPELISADIRDIFIELKS
jgi:hypothetical protein